MEVGYKQNNKIGPPRIIAISILATAALTTLAMLGWLLFRCHYGFDFTDESYYMIWISNPGIYDLCASQFGFIYHPLHQLLGGDIVLLRQGNILITFGLAWLLCSVFFRVTVGASEPILSRGNLPMLTMAAIIASSSLLLFSGIFGWLPTPNYNGLALQAMLLAGTGLLLAERSVTPTSLLGWVLIGVAGWLAFMAKPTTAAALGMATVVYLLSAGRCNVRLLGVALFTATVLLVVSAWMIDGSIFTFIERLKGGVDIYRQLGAGHTLCQLLRVDRFTLGKNDKLIFAIAAIATCICIHLVFSKKRGLVILGLSPLMTLALISLDFFPSDLFSTITLHSFLDQGVLIGAVPLGTLAAVVTSMRGVCFPKITRLQWALALCFTIFPYVYAVGHGGNYWHLGSGAGMFWVLASLVVLAPAISTRAGWHMLLPVAINVQLVTVLLLYMGMDNPYRQPQPLRLNNQPTIIGDSRSQLVLSHGFAEYIHRIGYLAQRAGFKPGTPMIDLSGHTPGTLYSLGAKSIGQPWMVGGYEGSERLAVFMLDRVSCEDIAQAWLLVESAGPRRLSPELLRTYGISFQRDYDKVGDLVTPSDARGYKEVYTQSLFKPGRPLYDAVATYCNRRRVLQ